MTYTSKIILLDLFRSLVTENYPENLLVRGRGGDGGFLPRLARIFGRIFDIIFASKHSL